MLPTFRPPQTGSRASMSHLNHLQSTTHYNPAIETRITSVTTTLYAFDELVTTVTLDGKRRSNGLHRIVYKARTGRTFPRECRLLTFAAGEAVSRMNISHRSHLL